jgi:hypothetical protein
VESRAKIPVKIAIDGESVRSETLASSVGAYVLVLDTVLPDHGVDLHSVYAGHPKVRTQAVHLLLAPGQHESLSVEHEHDEIPVMHARRRCLYDHLGHLQDFLQSIGLDAQIPIDDVAVAAVER